MKTYKKKIWTQKQKILFTVFLLLGVQFLSGVPTPGVNPEYFKGALAGNAAISFFNLLTGNGLQNISLSMLSVTPYITASIVVQLLTVVFPQLSELQKSGETGQKTVHKITLISGAVLALVEALGFSLGFGRQGLLVSYTVPWVLLSTTLWTLGSLLCIGAGELIEKKGFGNGISLILLCNIVSAYPSDIYTLYQRFMAKKELPVAMGIGAVIFIFVVLLFAFSIFIQKIERKISVTYSNKMQGKVSVSRSVFPIKLCPGTVVPIIFASSIMSMPSLVAMMFGKTFWITEMLNSSNWFKASNPSYSIGVPIYIVLIIGFSFFYTNMILNPVEIANNFKKTGATIPGIRPGQPTVDYLQKQINGTVGVGSIACCMIALLPCVLSGAFGLSRLSFAGTSILITAGVILEVWDRYKSEDKLSRLSLFH